ncbi:MAG: dephospho-CoA kinase [Firmicutes bacterium]|nr:dephospho-CoA kinase [Candidatus Fermentithermobacillaceae bacterium]
MKYKGLYVIGLTGGIASGKSTVSRMLRELGAVIIDADEVSREVVSPGTIGWRRVVDAFGAGILRPDGTINRRKLGGMNGDKEH